jgi:hypothetical protein
MEYVGRQWRSCKAWKSKGTSYWNGSEGRPKIEIKVNDAGFNIHYVGKASGYAISHANNGTGDTLHQVFNIIICECNPYLMKGKLKPDIKSIESSCSRSNGLYDMNIWIPFNKIEDGIYQINRRGGMGWDPGASAIKAVVGKVKNMEGPEKVVVKEGGVVITEYFVTYDVDPSSAKKSDSEKESDKPTDDKKEKEIPKKEKETVKLADKDSWYKYDNDNSYVYQQRGNMWFAKNVKSGKISNIALNPKFSGSSEKLDKAKKDNKLTIVK